jgi:hypothetical protein
MATPRVPPLGSVQKDLENAMTVLRAIHPANLTAVDRERVDTAKSHLLGALATCLQARPSR